MTRAIARHIGHPVRVHVLCDGRGRLLPDEARLLGARASHGRVREVVLDAGGRPLLAARTVHVSRRLQCHPGLLALGSRALGELLFEHGKPQYLHRQHALTGRGSTLGRLVCRATAGASNVCRACRACRARRTVYWFERQPLLVTEIFLPALVGG